jgi:hypothetical protein
VELSAAGRARRDAILGLALGAQRRRVRVRRAVRAATAAALVLAASAAAYVTLGGSLRAPSGPGVTIADAPEQAPQRPGALAWSVVQTDHSILDRVSVVTPVSVRTIDDAELSDLLEAAGTEAGVIRVGGRAMLESDLFQDPGSGT